LGILTVSTSGSQGQREDTSGVAIREALESQGYQVVRYEVVSDEKDTIAGRLAEWADAADVDLIVTTGGTGLGQRDVTPEACLSILDKEVPGLAEAMRAQTLQFTAMSMLSRSVAGIRGHTLIITLPGSTKGVGQCLDVVSPVLPHALELLRQETVNEHPN
jgi:molybdenum cofactor synthesis domain-containing protein